MKARVVIILLTIAAVVAAFVLSSSDGSSDAGQQAGKPADGAVKLQFAASPEKEKLLTGLIEQFNREQVKSNGRPVFVQLDIVSSGGAQDKIARGKLKPQVWSPASSLWGRLLNFQTDRQLVADDNPSLVRTPLVWAMWEPMARALGWPDKQVTTAQIIKLARSKDGWASVGRPQFGKFKLGHTNPDFSTSGLSAVASEYYAAAGKLEGLTVADVSARKVRQQVRDLERSIVHYGDTTLFFAEQLKKYGPSYASAVAMEEVTLLDYNRTRGSAGKLVAVYPQEGTFFSDNPLIVLQADWVSAEQKQAAQVLLDWLAEKVTARKAAQFGFRPADLDATPQAPVTKANGVDPSQPKRVLSLPSPQVIAKIKSFWLEDRKPANVLLVVDTSGSMGEDGKMEQAKRGLQLFLKQLSPHDRVGLVTFNSQVFPGVPIAPFSSNRAELGRAVRDLVPDGETAVYDATNAGVEQVEALGDDTRINAVVVLTDGEDTKSQRFPRPEPLISHIAEQSKSEGHGVRVFTIAYGLNENSRAREVMRQIAQASGGRGYEGDADDIESVYKQISSFF